MAVIAIITREPEPAPRLDALLQQHYPGKFVRWSDSVVVVSTADTPMQLSQKIGTKVRNPDGTLSGEFDDIFVTQLSASYWGFGPTAFWDWLKNAFEVTV